MADYLRAECTKAFRRKYLYIALLVCLAVRHPVLWYVLGLFVVKEGFMLVMGILVLLGLIGRLGKYLPAQSISGFLLVIGIAMTFAPNLVTVTTSENAMSGYIALGVTAWSKNPFLGMVVGVLVRYLGVYVGLV